MAKTSEAEKFHHKHGGYSYDPKKETKAQGRRRSAKQAAKAEEIAREHGWRFEWEHDPEPYEMGDAETETPDEVLTCVLYDENGEVLASLGGIGMSGTQRERKDYGRIIEAELAMEGASNKGLL